MLMAISFPDTVSAAAQPTSGAVRLDSASSADSQAVSAGNECSMCLVQKSHTSTDEDFEAVLAWMISGMVPQVHVPTVAESTDTISTPITVETGAAEVTNPFAFGQATAQVALAMPQQVASVPISARSQDQDVVEAPELLKNSVQIGLGHFDPRTTKGMIADKSLNDSDSLSRGESLNRGATQPRSQSAPVSANLQSIDDLEFLPAERQPFSLSVSTLSVLAEVQTTAARIPKIIYSNPFATPEVLSQDAIDALDRIVRLPGPMIFRTSAFTFQVSTTPASASPTFTLPVTALPTFTPPVSGSPTFTPPASALTESTLPTSILPVSKLPASRVSGTELQPSASPIAILPVSTTSELHALEGSSSSIPGTSHEALTSSTGTIVQPSYFPVAFESAESMVRPVKGRMSSDSHVAVPRNPGSLSSSGSHSAAETSSDFVRSDAVQSSFTNSLPNFVAAISSEMRQPLSNQVSQTIMEHIRRNGVRSNDSLTVRLDPPELGEMTIELSRTHDGLAVRVTAREAVTMDMLFVRGQEIETHLRGQQLNLKSLEFLKADMSGNGFSQGQQQSDASRRSENLMNQVRRGSRNSSPANVSVGRIAASDSAYGLSFRA